MLTNEQRAHDLTLLAVNILSSPEALKGKADENNNVKVDVFWTYVDVYRAMLEAMNKEFPSQ